MLFGSYGFIFLFLPAFLLIWTLIARSGYARHGLVAVFLFFSIFFYSLWGIGFLSLLLATICINYCFGQMLAKEDPDLQNCSSEKMGHGLSRKKIFICALAINLSSLAWFKYSWFIIRNVALLLGTDWEFTPPDLPMGISFYTFIQIAWLTGIYRGQFQTPQISHYALFSCAFPYVISGPIVRYEQIGWQIDNFHDWTAQDVAPGITLFCMGLAKKLILADSCGVYADAVFKAAGLGWPLSFSEAWSGSLFYTFQLYFDFSGYTDMALGIALMIGMKLPENFNSPYKATGIVDFWHRWHMTLSSWLRDFLYIPLGGNRHGKPRQYLNLFLTMLIGGIWHGAGWTYMIWGAMHGLMLGINHFFRFIIKNSAFALFLSKPPARILSILLTFFCLNFCWVIFRAPDLDAAIAMYKAMFLPACIESANPVPDMATGFLATIQYKLFPNHYIQDWQALILLCFCAFICWFFPNSGQIINGKTNSKIFPAWKPSATWAFAVAIMAFTSLCLLGRQATFLYFQF